MKIIFLDFDGPLIPMRAWMLNPLGKTKIEKFDPLAVAFLLYVLEADPSVRLVISSSWRDGGYDFVVQSLEYNGISRQYLHTDWATPLLVNHSMKDRPIEILDWLHRHPEIQDYVVIDDAQMNIPNLIKASSEDGISFENQLALMRRLNIKY